MPLPTLPDGVVYTETVVRSLSAAQAEGGSYQIAIIDVPGVGRQTVQIAADRPEDLVRIGETVTFVEHRNAIPYYRRCD